MKVRFNQERLDRFFIWLGLIGLVIGLVAAVWSAYVGDQHRDAVVEISAERDEYRRRLRDLELQRDTYRQLCQDVIEHSITHIRSPQ